MKNQIKKQNKNIPVTHEQPEPPKKPTLPPVFERPPLTSSFSQGSRIRLDQRRQFFSRTRRGGI